MAGAALWIAAAIAAQAEPAMWVVRDHDSTIYLIGTVHVLRPEMVWNSEKVMKAIGESTELWLEVLEAEEAMAVAPLIQKLGVDMEKPLSKKLNAKQKARLAKVAGTFGIPVASLEPMKPWVVATMLTVLQVQKAGYDAKSGVERVLQTQAEKEGDKVVGLETLEEQVGFFAGLSDAEQIAFLEQTLEDAEEGVALLDRLAKAWSEGDVDTITRVVVDELKREAPNVYDKLLVQRNIRWAQKVQQLLHGSGVHQIAVGAGHLAGRDSLQAQLAKRGIKAERF
ncbi:MAG TPA: TraB/GumN family protein [Chthoniobacterales bacterium]|nr:TraB/GumN family protein [Chthoniobacterales bacterium]